MALIRLITEIRAPVEVVFDLSRSVELHLDSTQKTGEHVIAGRAQGLFELHDEVTWRAKHFGVWQTLSVRISDFHRPHRFVDEMTRGVFTQMRHEHLFEVTALGTRMTDNFAFQAPLGILGVLAETLFLKSYMKKFLIERNAVIKSVAERGRVHAE